MFTIALCLPGAAAGPRPIRALCEAYFSQRGESASIEAPSSFIA